MKLKLKRIDWYIIKQFLGTYVFAIALIISISVVFDINEKIDKFLNPDVPLKAIIVDYYMNFIPYFANLFSPLFTFIAVIFFTSKLADRSEIIAMLSSGMSFRRLMLPYALSAAIIAAVTFVLNAYIIPPANKTRIDFQNKYIRNKKVDYVRNAQLEIEPGVIAYFDSYDARSNMGYRFSLEHFEEKKLVSRLTAKSIKYDSLYQWTVIDYMIRDWYLGELRKDPEDWAVYQAMVDMNPSISQALTLACRDAKEKAYSVASGREIRLLRHHHGGVYPDGHRRIALLPEDKGRHGAEHRYRAGAELFLYPVHDHHLHICDQRQREPRRGGLDPEHPLFLHRRLPLPESAEIRAGQEVNPYQSGGNACRRSNPARSRASPRTRSCRALFPRCKYPDNPG